VPAGATADTATAAPTQPHGPLYRVELVELHAHLYDLTLHICQPARQQRVSLPVWIPGSYLVREFAQHLHGLRADCDGHAVPLRQLNKNTWEAATPAGAQLLRLRYQVYAYDASVRSAWLDAERGFFNPTSLCLRVHGQESLSHTLELWGSAATQDWQVATALAPITPDAAHADAPHSLGYWQAADYDQLADSPIELGRLWSASFSVRGVAHRLVVSGAGPGFDGERLLRDTQTICQAAIEFWHGAHEAPPFGHYLFMLNARHEGYGGLEHRHSTALICRRADLPQLPLGGALAPALAPTPAQVPALGASDGYTSLLGLIGHEYFHAWHVKRLRPAEYTRYDYDREQHTELLWLFEGFTSYFDDLLLLRAGLIDEACYLQLLAKTLNQVLHGPGRLVHSLAQSSFEAWTKYYRVNENSPNATVSYYAKGSLVALALDLQLRAEGRCSLDAVLRALYQRCQGGPMHEADLLAVLEQCGGRSYAPEIAAWVHGCADLPLPDLLRTQGIDWLTEPAPLAQRLGLRVSETEGLLIKNVLRGSLAEQAGLAAGDEWLGLEVGSASSDCTSNGNTRTANDSTSTTPSAWRVRTLDEVARHAYGQHSVVALVARDGRLLRLPLRWPTPEQPQAHTVRLQRPSKPASPAPASPTPTQAAGAHPVNLLGWPLAASSSDRP
jgi:predicted metalloprotease with PDZ domain